MRKYIDAEKAIEVCDWYEHEYSECEEYIRTIAEDIRRLPAADVAKVRRGRWIMHIDDLFPAESTMECSQCHEEQPLECDDNYCPNCGAKMDGEQNG